MYYKYPLYWVVLWCHSYINTVFPDSVIQNIVKIFVRNSHDFVEWTWAIQSEYETLINHSKSKPRIQSEWKTTLGSFNNYVDRILPIFKLISLPISQLKTVPTGSYKLTFDQKFPYCCSYTLKSSNLNKNIARDLFIRGSARHSSTITTKESRNMTDSNCRDQLTQLRSGSSHAL